MHARTCSVASPGQGNSYRPIVLNQCTNLFANVYALLITTGYNSYDLLYGCSDASCSQCPSQLTIAEDICTPDPNNSTYSFILSNSHCLNGETNPATIPSTSVSLIFNSNSTVCQNVPHVDTLTFGSVTSTRTCMPFAYGFYAWMQSNGKNYNGGVWCNSSCGACNQTFTNVPLATCTIGSLYNTSFIVQLTSALSTCYTMPTYMYLSHVNDL